MLGGWIFAPVTWLAGKIISKVTYSESSGTLNLPSLHLLLLPTASNWVDVAVFTSVIVVQSFFFTLSFRSFSHKKWQLIRFTFSVRNVVNELQFSVVNFLSSKNTVRTWSILGSVRWCIYVLKVKNIRGYLVISLTKLSYKMYYFMLTVKCKPQSTADCIECVTS